MTPFRDEKESLRAENERLHAELAKQRARRVPRVGIAIALVAVVAAVALQPWLNGSDVRFWAAVAILGALVLAAVVAALRGT